MCTRSHAAEPGRVRDRKRTRARSGPDVTSTQHGPVSLRVLERRREAFRVRAADLAARYLATRPDDAILAACDGLVLQVAAEGIAEAPTRPCWSRLDVERFLHAVGGFDALEVRRFAIESLASYYAWLVLEGVVPLDDVAPVLRALDRYGPANLPELRAHAIVAA
jgi:hypothetical protein